MTAMKTKATITVELNEDQAQALAQFIKRYTWTDVRQNAVNDEEAYLMREAFDALQYAMADAGYAPR